MRQFNRLALLTASVACVCTTASASCQTATSARVPIVELSAPQATSSDHFGLVLNVRALPDGHVLVNDGSRHQLNLLDANLGNRTVVLDSGLAGSRSYGTFSSALIPYLADSSLFVDRGSVSLVVIDPAGQITRVVAPPVPSHLLYLNARGTGVDAEGNLVYAMEETRVATAPRDTAAYRKRMTGGDSVLLVRASFQKGGVLDTIGRARRMASSRITFDIVGAQTTATSWQDPMPSQDDFAVLADGTIAFVRGHDYHVDVVLPGGQHISGPKLPFDWKRLTDGDKQELVDSTEAFNRKMAEMIKQMASGQPPAPNAPIYSKQGSAVGEGVMPQPRVVDDIAQRSAILPAAQIDDYYPPIRSGALRPDLDNNLWILPTTSAQSKAGELIYDVVNNQGELVRRVRVPTGRSIAGFGKGGIVYLMSKDADGWTLERTRVLTQERQ